MKTHKRFEFVFYNECKSFIGDSVQDVFNALPEEYFNLGQTDKTKAKLCLEHFGITEQLPEISKDRNVFYEEFFRLLQEKQVGSWKWFDSLANEDFWRYDPTKNDYVRRVGKGRGQRSPEGIEHLKQNLAISHERRRNNPELARQIAIKAGSAKKKNCHYTEEQKKAAAIRLRNGRLKRYAEMTDEEKAEKRRKISESIKAMHARRREAGIEYKGAKADRLAKEMENKENAQ